MRSLVLIILPSAYLALPTGMRGTSTGGTLAPRTPLYFFSHRPVGLSKIMLTTKSGLSVIDICSSYYPGRLLDCAADMGWRTTCIEAIEALSPKSSF